MTEQEAIKLHISENIHRIEVIEDFLSTNSDANDKECRKNIDILTKINKALEEVQQYRAIGTPKECRPAVEKQKAKKVTDIHVDEYRCPACGSENTTSDALTVGDHYCPNCGQRLE